MRVKLSSGMLAAFAALYFIWGSTYLVIKVLVDVFPPFLMAGIRATAAGLILYAWARYVGTPAPTRAEWQRGMGAGALWFVGGHGALYWGSQHLPSGLAAVLFSTIPVWVAVFDGLASGPGLRTPATATGVALGLVGITWLNLPTFSSGAVPWASVVVLVGAASWAMGMVWYRGARRPTSRVLAAALPMVTGGVSLLGVSALTGEIAHTRLTGLDATAVLSLAYLIVFGSLITFSAYSWLLEVVSPTKVASYAYVNPVVALLLGWLIAGERLTPAMFGAVAMTLASVGLIVLGEPMPVPHLQPTPTHDDD